MRVGQGLCTNVDLVTVQIRRNAMAIVTAESEPASYVRKT